MPTRVLSDNTPSAINGTPTTTAVAGAIETAYINKFNPTVNFGSELIDYFVWWNGSDESSILYTFDLSHLSGEDPATSHIFYPYVIDPISNPAAAEIYEILPAVYDSATATWNIASTGNPWNTAGAEGVGTDRGASLLASVSFGTFGFHPGIDLTALINANYGNTVTIIITPVNEVAGEGTGITTPAGTNGQRPELVSIIPDGGGPSPMPVFMHHLLG